MSGVSRGEACYLTEDLLEDRHVVVDVEHLKSLRRHPSLDQADHGRVAGDSWAGGKLRSETPSPIGSLVANILHFEMHREATV